MARLILFEWPENARHGGRVIMQKDDMYIEQAERWCLCKSKLFYWVIMWLSRRTQSTFVDELGEERDKKQSNLNFINKFCKMYYVYRVSEHYSG